MREIQSYISESNITSLDTKKASFVDVSNISMSMKNYREMKQQNQLEEREEKKDVEMILLAFNSPRQQVNIEQNPKNTSKDIEKTDKQKLVEYWKLADLSYIELKTDKNKSWNDKYSFNNLKLDPLVYPNIQTVVSWDELDEIKISSLTKEERELYEYIQDWLKTDNNKEYLVDTPTIEEKRFLSSLWLNEQNLAENEEKYRTVLTDIMPKTTYDQKYSRTRYLANTFFRNQLKESKENFDKLKQDYTILDYFPNEQKWENWDSWFWGVLLEKWWKKFIAIRWTEITDFWDLKEDSKLAIWRFPDKQSKDLIKFIDRVIKPWEKFNIVWHSLWWALSQITTSMYANQVEETYTFNSPWVANLTIDNSDRQKFVKFRDFEYNKEKVWDKIVNVRWDSWIMPIANLWKDLWNYEIVLKNLLSHSITETVSYIEKLDKNSEELKKVKIKKKEEKYKNTTNS